MLGKDEYTPKASNHIPECAVVHPISDRKISSFSIQVGDEPSGVAKVLELIRSMRSRNVPDPAIFDLELSSMVKAL